MTRVTETSPPLEPAASRIDNLDVLRGIAILGILFINLPGAATYFAAFFGLEFLAGWSRADQVAWAAMEIFIDGTQRGLLQFLFGAGMLILTAKALAPDGPVGVADIYYRRNMWLMVFGLANIFLLLFPGDILFIYAVAALFLFPFRRLGPRMLLAIGLLWVAYSGVAGAVRYAERAELQQRAESARKRAAAGLPAGPAEAQALAAWAELEKQFRPDPEALRADREKRLGPFLDYARYNQQVWVEYRARTLGVFFHDIPESVRGDADRSRVVQVADHPRGAETKILCGPRACCLCGGPNAAVDRGAAAPQLRPGSTHCMVHGRNRPPRYDARSSLAREPRSGQRPGAPSPVTIQSGRAYRILALRDADLDHVLAAFPWLRARTFWPVRLGGDGRSHRRNHRVSVDSRQFVAALVQHGPSRVGMAIARAPKTSAATKASGPSGGTVGVREMQPAPSRRSRMSAFHPLRTFRSHTNGPPT
jgi:hypothetical protein